MTWFPRGVWAGLTLLGILACVPDLSGDRAPPVPTALVLREDFVRRVSAEGELVPVEATPIVAPADSEQELKIAWLAPEGRRILKGDIVVRFDATEATRSLADGEASLASAQRRLEKERLASDATVRAKTLRAQLAGEEEVVAREFQARDGEIYSRQQLVSSALDSELLAAKKEHADEIQTIEGSLAGSRLELIRIEADRARNDIARAKKALSLLEIPAPHDGVLLPKKDWRGNSVRTGDTIWPGQPVAEIPALGALDAKVWVLEADAAGLAEGRPARVTMAARPGSPLDGAVRRAENLARPRPNLGPIQYFEAVLSLKVTDPTWMKPGQRVTALLDLGGASAVVVPRQAVFEDGEGTFAWRKEGKRWERATIELGIGSAGRVTVSSGLDEGDEVALRDPNHRGSEAGPKNSAAGAPTPGSSPPGGRGAGGRGPGRGGPH